VRLLRAVPGQVWAWLRTLAGVGILALLVWRLGTGGFLAGLRAVDVPALGLAVAIGLVTTVGCAWRWCLVARGMGIRLPLGEAVGDYYRSLFLNSALPGGILGDVHRAVRHGQQVGSVGRGVRAVALERTAGQVVLVAVTFLVLLVKPFALSRAVVLGILAVLVLALAAGAYAGRRHLPALRRGLRHWPGVLLASSVALLGHLATFVLATRVAGSSAPVGSLLPMMLLALVVMGLPVNIGGWGPREGFVAWAFGVAGLGATLGLTVAVVYGVLAFASSLPGAGVIAVRWVHALRKAPRPAPRPLALSVPSPTRPLARQGGAVRG